MLKVNSTLQRFILSKNSTEDVDAVAIAEAITIYLDCNKIGNREAAAFSHALDMNLSLESLYLRHNLIAGADGDGGRSKAEINSKH